MMLIQRIKKDSNFINLGSLTRIERGVQLYDLKKHTKDQIQNDFLRINKLPEFNSQDNYYPELLWVLLPFTFLVALSRVILGLHYPS
ncbi:MAG: hypothetical protein RLZZ86_1470, partial [Cyanobacteriota bacterium]